MDMHGFLKFTEWIPERFEILTCSAYEAMYKDEEHHGKIAEWCIDNELPGAADSLFWCPPERVEAGFPYYSWITERVMTLPFAVNPGEAVEFYCPNDGVGNVEARLLTQEYIRKVWKERTI